MDNLPIWTIWIGTASGSLRGWVFSGGSMAFTGSVPVDPKTQRIVRNILDAALAG